MVETRSKGGEPTDSANEPSEKPPAIQIKLEVAEEPIEMDTAEEQRVQEPKEEQPLEEQPLEEQSKEDQPEEEQPHDEQPKDGQLLEEQIKKEQPTEEQPTEEQPTEEQPTGEQPTDKKTEDVDDEAEDEEDEDEDDVKVTIEDFDTMKTLQKQQQSTAKPAAPIFDLHQEPIECQQLDDKPWRKPGADITDYFNYGFDESTWQKYCDRQKEIKGIADEIKEPPTFNIPVVYGPMVQANVVAYDDSMNHVVMDHRNAPIAQSVGMQHQQHQHQHHPSGGSGRMKNVEDERRHNRSTERQHMRSRERRHSKSRDREREREKDKDREKDKERKRSRSRDRRSKVSRTRQRSQSRDDDRRSKRHKSSRHA